MGLFVDLATELDIFWQIQIDKRTMLTVAQTKFATLDKSTKRFKSPCLILGRSFVLAWAPIRARRGHNTARWKLRIVLPVEKFV